MEDTLPLPPSLLVIYAVIAINFAAFVAFGLDKACAEQGHRRIRETTLLQLAFFGGTIGAYAGRALFRHKTRKRSFSEKLHAVTVVQVLLAVGFAVYFNL